MNLRNPRGVLSVLSDHERIEIAVMHEALSNFHQHWAKIEKGDYHRDLAERLRIEAESIRGSDRVPQPPSDGESP